MEDEDFSNAAPHLFGAGFEKKAKERSEAVTCLRKASSSDLKKMGEHNSHRFFQESRPSGEEAERMLAATVANTTRIANKGAFHQRTAQKGRPDNECPTLLHTECNVNTILYHHKIIS